MDRIGVFREAYRVENRRVFLSAPVSFWRRVRFSVLALCLMSFLSGFFVGKAQAVGGTLQKIVVCSEFAPAGSTPLYSGVGHSPPQGTCDSLGTYKQWVIDAYVIDAAYKANYEDWLTNQTNLDWLAANRVAIQNTLNNQSTLAAANFDPAVAGQFYAWGFTGLILVGCVAWGAGSILGFANRVFG